MNKTSKKCHVIPKFYLKEFIEETPPKGHEPYLWVFDFNKGNWRKKAPKNIAYELDLYAFMNNIGIKSFEIEEAFSKLEGEMSTVFRNKVKNRQCLSDYERAVVSEFVAVMMTRKIKFKDEINSFLTDIAIKFLQVFQARPQDFDYLRDKYKRETGKDFPKIDANILSNIEIEATHDFLLGTRIALISEIKKDIYIMNWAFLFSHSNFFITSDSPVVLYNPSPITKFDGAGIYNLEIYFPLSKNICMIISWNFKLRSFIDVPQTLVERINKRIIHSSYKFIVAPIKDFVGINHLKSKFSTYNE